jgi:glutamate-1-semialdehyde 2,1-aminomutase/spore coat polysaccharide biosynthesis protein SpsF
VLDLGGRPVLDHVLRRCRAIPGADVVVCAIADEENTPLPSIAETCGVEVFVGPVRDVLARYAGAAHRVKADVVVRITSDCPLIDPIVCGQVIRMLTESGAEYASNIQPRTYPKGLDCEVFTYALLERANAAATEVSDREHVTPWMLRVPALRTANLSSTDARLAEQRWTLDYPEDLEFLRKVCALLPSRMAHFDEIAALLRTRRDLLAINAQVSDTPSNKTTVAKV